MICGGFGGLGGIMRLSVVSLRLLLVVSVFGVSGCASITRGTKDTLVIESDPLGADVTLSNGLKGKTPATFKLPRKEAVVVKIEREGYEPVEVQVIPQVVGAGAAGMAGNVLVGGLIGVAVDASTGSMKDLKPNPVSVKLVPLASLNALTQPAAPPSPLPPLAPEPAPTVQSGTPPVQQAQAPSSGEAKPGSTQEERLKQLDELHGKGLVSDQEYENNRAQIMAEVKPEAATH